MRSPALVAALLTAALAAAPARADDARTGEAVLDEAHEAPSAAERAEQGDVHFVVAARAGYASGPIRGAVSPFGAGFGGRAALVIGGLYMGATVVDYLGGGDGGASEHAIMYGAELAYEIHVAGPWTLRPMLGVGGASLVYTEPLDPGKIHADVITTASGRSVSGSVATSSTTTIDNAYVEPSLALLYAMGTNFVGAEASAIYAPGVTYSDGSVANWLSFGLHLDLGHRF